MHTGKKNPAWNVKVVIKSNHLAIEPCAVLAYTFCACRELNLFYRPHKSTLHGSSYAFVSTPNVVSRFPFRGR